MRTDTQLVVDYLEGNEKALGILVDRYLKDVYNFSFKLAGDLQAAEDITQESFIKSWKYVRTYRRGDNFKTWLLTITRNTAIDWLRQKKDIAFSAFQNERGENAFVESLESNEPLPDELLESARDKKFVQSLLTRINPSFREVLTLRYESNLTFREIGEILQRPLHSVKSQHRRALASLRRLLQAQTT